MPGDSVAVPAPTAASPGEAGLPRWDAYLDGIRAIAVGAETAPAPGHGNRVSLAFRQRQTLHEIA